MTEVGFQSAPFLCLSFKSARVDAVDAFKISYSFLYVARCPPFPHFQQRKRESFTEIKKPRLLEQPRLAMRARRIPRAERVCVCVCGVRKNARRM